MAKKRKYFPNNWEAYSNAPAEYFESLPFEQFMDWKVEGWELPSSVVCLIREEDHSTGKVKEYIYSKPQAAVNFINKLMDAEQEFIICDEEQVQLMLPSND